MTDTLGDAGESAALARIFPRLPAASAQLLGPGDDAAVLAAPDGRVVITTDMMIHGPDFRLAWSSAHDLGWKAAASNLSDVAAMGARPTALVVALAAPESTTIEFLEQFADGLRDGCAALAPGCGVIGGDLSVSPTLTIAVTAFGDLEGREPVLRSGARVGRHRRGLRARWVSPPRACGCCSSWASTPKDRRMPRPQLPACSPSRGRRRPTHAAPHRSRTASPPQSRAPPRCST